MCHMSRLSSLSSMTFFGLPFAIGDHVKIWIGWFWFLSMHCALKWSTYNQPWFAWVTSWVFMNSLCSWKPIWLMNELVESCRKLSAAMLQAASIPFSWYIMCLMFSNIDTQALMETYTVKTIDRIIMDIDIVWRWRAVDFTCSDKALICHTVWELGSLYG